MKTESAAAIPRRYIIIAQTAGCLWLTAWAFFIFVASHDNDRPWIEKLASIGDSFGPLSAFLTVAALFTTAISTYVQIHEFRNQLKEMTESKEELAHQTRALQLQLNEMRKQTANDLLYKTIAHIPRFEVSLSAKQKNEECNLTIENTGEEVWSLEVFCYWTFPLSKKEVVINATHDRIERLASAESEFFQRLDCTGIEIATPLIVSLSYTLFTGVSYNEEFEVYQGYSTASIRSEIIEDLRRIVWESHGVFSEQETASPFELAVAPNIKPTDRVS